MKYIKPAWFFKNKLEEEQNLFSISNIETDYVSYTYMCYCGKVENVIGRSKTDYRCSCGNSTFLNMDEANIDFSKFSSHHYFNKKIKIGFEPHYKIDILNNKVQAICFIKVPSEVDKNLNIQKYKDVIITSVVPNKTNKVNKIPKEYPKLIHTKLVSMISNIEDFEKYIDIKLSRRGSKIREKQLYFFLNHINLKDKEFFNWRHGELLKGENLTIDTALVEFANNKKYKSVKKAIYRNYQFQMEQFKIYNPLLTYLATSKIDDPNFIVELINMKYINSDKLLSKLNKDMLFEFTDFLVKYYSYKQVIHFFRNFDNFLKMNSENFKRSYLAFQDILRQFNIIKYDLDKDSKKVRCTPGRIHNHFSKILNLKKYKHLMIRKLSYTTSELKAQTKIGNYSIKLPHNGTELYTWADDLRNCMASYLKEIENNQTIIYGFFADEKIVFAVEIRNGKVLQAYRSYNRELTSLDKSLLSQWFRDFYSNSIKNTISATL